MTSSRDGILPCLFNQKPVWKTDPRLCWLSERMSMCLVMLMLFFSVPAYLIQFFFPLWPAGGVLHFHPDNVCSEDRDKVSMKHELCLLPLLCSWFE